MKQKTIVINTDENADWIKRVHDGVFRAEELLIHAELDAAAKNADKKG